MQKYEYKGEMLSLEQRSKTLTNVHYIWLYLIVFIILKKAATFSILVKLYLNLVLQIRCVDIALTMKLHLKLHKTLGIQD